MSGSGRGSRTARASSRAASSSASRSPAPSIARPEVIFADEPTGALDTRTGKDILDLLREAVDGLGQTVVMVTHDPMPRVLRRYAWCSSPTARSWTSIDRPPPSASPSA